MQLRRLESSNTERTDETVLAILRQDGPQTLDTLSAATGLEWGQTFLIVDRLSRVGSVSLRRAGACEYRISVGIGAH
jgi:hypothetical protein